MKWMQIALWKGGDLECLKKSNKLMTINSPKKFQSNNSYSWVILSTIKHARTVIKICSIYSCHERFLHGRNLRTRPLLYVRACCATVRMTLYKGRIWRKNFLPVLTILLVIDVIVVARSISIFIISNSIFFLYVAVHVCTNSIINK